MQGLKLRIAPNIGASCPISIEDIGLTFVQCRCSRNRHSLFASHRVELGATSNYSPVLPVNLLPVFQADISDLERRSNAAEMRHQDLTAKLPDAMRPLLRQIEAMQVGFGIVAQFCKLLESHLISHVMKVRLRILPAGGWGCGYYHELMVGTKGGCDVIMQGL